QPVGPQLQQTGRDQGRQHEGEQGDDRRRGAEAGEEPRPLDDLSGGLAGGEPRQAPAQGRGEGGPGAWAQDLFVALHSPGVDALVLPRVEAERGPDALRTFPGDVGTKEDLAVDGAGRQLVDETAGGGDLPFRRRVLTARTLCVQARSLSYLLQ